MSDQSSGCWFIPVLLIGSIWWWNAGPKETEADRHIVEGSTSLVNPKGEFDEESARADAAADVSASSFTDVGDTSTCTDDCSGHDAGFEWAKENDITEGSQCSGNSPSFIEGCEAFASAIEEQVDEAKSEHDEEE